MNSTANAAKYQQHQNSSFLQRGNTISVRITFFSRSERLAIAINHKELFGNHNVNVPSCALNGPESIWDSMA